MIGRMCFMFDNISPVIDAGIPHVGELKIMDTTHLTPEYPPSAYRDVRTAFTKLLKTWDRITLFAFLLELIPNLPDMLRKCGPNGIQGVARQVRNCTAISSQRYC